MKTKTYLVLVVLASLFISFSSCKKDNITDGKNIVPKSFKIDIPESISSDNNQKSATSDSLTGNEIYSHLRTFVHVGESAADIVQGIMTVIYKHELNKPMSFSYTSDEDGRVKNCVIIENGVYNGQTYQYRMTVTDAEFEGNEDAGVAIQVYWDKDPIQGVAILKFRNINVNTYEYWGDAKARITYSEVPEGVYEKTMVVEISDLPQRADRFWLNNLKMKVAKVGDRLDIYGNSDHPDAWFLVNHPVGYDWAFVASVNQTLDISVAEVGLPSDSLDSDNRNVILVDNSIKSVLTYQFRQWFLENYGIEPDSASLSNYLHNADAYGYFNTNGFVSGGTAPNSDYEALISPVQNLTPYNPFDIKQLTFGFEFTVAK